MREKPKDRLKRQEVRRPRSQGSTRAQRGRQNCADPPREKGCCRRQQQQGVGDRLNCTAHLTCLTSNLYAVSPELCCQGNSSIFERHAAMSTEP